MAPDRGQPLLPQPLGDTIRVFALPALGTLIIIGLLTSCAAEPIGGPTAPRGARDAGTLTLPSGRTYPVYPDELAYTGAGSFRWPDGRSYDGALQGGRPEGMGTSLWPNGDRYRGTWHEGLMHGHGELTRSDGSRYLGDFVAGRRQGQGVEQSNEGLYRGSWANDLPNGHGQLNDSEGAVYVGGWVDGRREGYGVHTDNRGVTYDGEWFDDQPDGFGKLTNPDASGYEGEWHAGTQRGYGTSVSVAGTVYEGTWIDGLRNGFGVVRRPDGSRYEGEWADGRRQGRGRETFADGSFHDGTWVADQPQGPGTRRDRTDIEISGDWNGDSVRSARLRLPSGVEYEGRLLTKRNTVVDAGLLAWLEARGEAGDAYAQFFLGTAYTDFASPVPDPFRATGYFRSAARAGVPEAQFRLALLLMERTPDQAMTWLKKAAADGQAQANTLLGEYHLTGNRVAPDTGLAIAYLEAAVAAGDMTAVNNLAWVLATTDRDEVKDGERALALIRPLALMRGDWQHLDTLAAAYAAVRQYGDANDALERAIAEASRELGADSPEVAAMRERLDAYRARAADDS